MKYFRFFFGYALKIKILMTLSSEVTLNILTLFEKFMYTPLRSSSNSLFGLFGGDLGLEI